LITAIEVVYNVENVGSFVADPNDYPLLNVSRLKVMMKRDGLTPKEITDPKTLGKYWTETLRDRETEFQKRLKKMKANLKSSDSPQRESGPRLNKPID
jgi:hypothetical protein